MKRTNVELWHLTEFGTAIRQSGGLLGSRRDHNCLCGSVGLTKVWACAENEFQKCCSHGSRVRIAISDLLSVSLRWHAYRTRHWQGYRCEGKRKHFELCVYLAFRCLFSFARLARTERFSLKRSEVLTRIMEARCCWQL